MRCLTHGVRGDKRIATHGAAPRVGSLVACYCLAVTSTLLSGAISAAAGWSRGEGTLTSTFWACLGIIATSAAHLLPAATRIGHGLARWLTWPLWSACMTFVVISHGSYFMSSQQATGEIRGLGVAPPPAAAARPLSRVMTDRARLEVEIVTLASPGCAPECTAARRKVTALRSAIAALDQEAQEIKQLESATAAYAEAKERAQRDPALWVMARWMSVPVERLQLILGLLVGLLLDGIGCVLWMLILTGRARLSEFENAECDRPARRSHVPVEDADRTSYAPPPDAIIRTCDENTKQTALLAKARAAIDGGQLRNTVRALRQHLECSQETAMAISRALKASP